jgi:hypothetical protein
MKLIRDYNVTYRRHYIRIESVFMSEKVEMLFPVFIFLQNTSLRFCLAYHTTAFIIPVPLVVVYLIWGMF